MLGLLARGDGRRSLQCDHGVASQRVRIVGAKSCVSGDAGVRHDVDPELRRGAVRRDAGAPAGAVNCMTSERRSMVTSGHRAAASSLVASGVPDASVATASPDSTVPPCDDASVVVEVTAPGLGARTGPHAGKRATLNTTAPANPAPVTAGQAIDTTSRACPAARVRINATLRRHPRHLALMLEEALLVVPPTRKRGSSASNVLFGDGAKRRQLAALLRGGIRRTHGGVRSRGTRDGVMQRRSSTSPVVPSSTTAPSHAA